MDRALEDQFNLVASYVALVIECGAFLAVTFGVIKTVARGEATRNEGREI